MESSDAGVFSQHIWTNILSQSARLVRNTNMRGGDDPRGAVGSWNILLVRCSLGICLLVHSSLVLFEENECKFVCFVHLFIIFLSFFLIF